MKGQQQHVADQGFQGALAIGPKQSFCVDVDLTRRLSTTSRAPGSGCGSTNTRLYVPRSVSLDARAAAQVLSVLLIEVELQFLKGLQFLGTDRYAPFTVGTQL